MSNYLAWDKQSINPENEHEVKEKFELGFVFTRENYGSIYQTRSLRINLANFSLSSENRRILAKVEGLKVELLPLPLLDNYDWTIAKLGKDYYETKFGPGVFSANKIRELLTEKSNFNLLLKYSLNDQLVGYTICYDSPEFLQYAYPYYDLVNFANNFGMGMMLKAILNAQEATKKYIYIGSASRPADTYKFQFSGLEWFDGTNWKTDLDTLKKLIET